METILGPQAVQTVTEAVPLLLRFPMKRFWVDYDREADVLYISFRHPPQATDTKMTEDGILLRSRGKELVGITVLDASTRTKSLKLLRPNDQEKRPDHARAEAPGKPLRHARIEEDPHSGDQTGSRSHCVGKERGLCELQSTRGESLRKTKPFCTWPSS